MAKVRFESFAREFVRAYWETVKSGDFDMPPNEPVHETVEELLSAISHETGAENSSALGVRLYTLRMTSKDGGWWFFSFVDDSRGWKLVSCSAKSDDDSKPHNLLDAVYSQYFEAFLRYVTKTATERSGI